MTLPSRVKRRRFLFLSARSIVSGITVLMVDVLAVTLLDPSFTSQTSSVLVSKCPLLFHSITGVILSVLGLVVDLPFLLGCGFLF